MTGVLGMLGDVWEIMHIHHLSWFRGELGLTMLGGKDVVSVTD